MCVSTVTGELWALFAPLFLAAETAFVCLVGEYEKEDSFSSSFIIVSPVQGELFEEKERSWEAEKERRGRERGRERRKESAVFFFLSPRKPFRLIYVFFGFLLYHWYSKAEVPVPISRLSDV